MGYVTYGTRGRVGTITINRPEALNALNSQVLADLETAIDQAAADGAVDVVILAGAGRAFAAGADIGEMRDMTAAEGKRFSDEGNRIFLKLENMEKPTICAVDGYALGGGCELAMSCDIRLAGETAKFGQPEVGFGITPGFGGTQRLPRLVGVSAAMEMILTGRTIDAVEAERIGLVSQVYPPEELMDRAVELAETIAAQARVAVRQAKACIRRGMQTDMATGLSYESQAFGLCFSTADQSERMTAFLDSRHSKADRRETAKTGGKTA